MLRCLACSAAVEEAHRYCPACGSAVESSLTPTGTAPRPAPPESPVPPGRVTPARPSGSGSASASHRSGPGVPSRFVPGAILAERYRVVALLGRGGMGEVYRADDLKLGQPVALKLLPERLAEDPELLARFFGEVRIARQITHPNVSRVHDIGEAAGLHFLSMEYVDGEDLASLLRRIGRLPGGKALSIARQLCAGLAAAHERDVLHRDLKPANVMIDGRGDARIMDFGLAGLAESFSGAELRSGTPAYMSPEQLEGREVTRRSDVYALGLILYELFTGKRTFEGRTLAELTRQHAQAAPPGLSEIVADVDPAVEDVILRCLEKDPARRPASALAVAAALPGGNPLAAALAAGETPSPELVAAAGERGALAPRVAWAFLGAVLAGLALFTALRPAFREVALEKSPEVLEDRARELLERLAASEAPVDRARGFLVDHDYLQHVGRSGPSPARWERLEARRPPLVRFWFRESPRPLVSTSTLGVVFHENPPPLVAGMTGLELDPRGRLVSFYRVTPQHDASGAATTTPADWSALFAEAGLDPDAFEPAAPEWTPPFYCDERAAWRGRFPEQPDLEARIEAAAYRGQPVYFEILTPWSRPERMRAFQFTKAQRLAQAMGIGLSLCSLATGVLLARRNLRAGRSDRKGATRLAAYVFWASMAVWALSAGHVADFREEAGLLVKGLGSALALAGTVWVLYLALEPHVRKRWPERMIAWSRLLAGRLRDPLVGRDLLTGVLVGVVTMLFHRTTRLAIEWSGQRSAPTEPFQRLDALLGVRRLAAELLASQIDAVASALFILVFLLLLRVLLRREWLAAGMLVSVLALRDALGAGEIVLGLILFLLTAIEIGAFLWVLARFGLLTAIAANVCRRWLIEFPLTLDFSAWHAGASTAVLLACAGVAAYGFHTSLAGRPLLAAGDSGHASRGG